MLMEILLKKEEMEANERRKKEEYFQSYINSIVDIKEKKQLEMALENMQVFLECAICSFGSLGFSYNKKSTLSRFINHIRFRRFSM